MDEKVIVAFAKWMQTKDKQLAQVPTKQLAQQVVQALQTEEGQKQLQPLFQQFQTEMQGGMFKSGGKLDQAVKKMSGGGETENTRQKEVLAQSKIPSKNYHDIVGMGNYIYKKIGDTGYENRPDAWGDSWIPYDGTHHYAELDALAAGSPSTSTLDEIRNKLGQYHPDKVINGKRYLLKTMPAKITKAEAVEDVRNGADYSRPETWNRNGIDSTLVVLDDPHFPKAVSNSDFTVRAYRNIPAFRKIADNVGWQPAFIHAAKEYNEKK